MLKILCNFLLFFFKFFIPIDRNLIIFGDRAGTRFCDNSRYLFFYINELKTKRCVWISQDKNIVRKVRKLGYESYLNNSIVGIFLALRADWHIYNFAEADIHNFLSKYSKSINLWHGILFKKIKKFKDSNFFNFNNSLVKKYIVYPNKKYSHHVLNQFPKWKYKLLISNQPRNILLSNFSVENYKKFTTTDEKKICAKIIKRKKKVIGYFPTWRNNGLGLFPNTQNIDDMIKLNNILKKRNYTLLVKKHPNSYKKGNHLSYNKKIDLFYKKIRELSNFYLLDYDTDLNSIMHLCDSMISDYSGAIFDYLLLNRTILFYAPDQKIYEKVPGMHFKLNNISIGPVVNNFTSLLKILDKHLKNPIILRNRYKKKRNKFKKEIFENNNCFEQIINIVN
jgi:CDP-glycerol glycerophosphotransferase (TagB/SpsB family)